MHDSYYDVDTLDCIFALNMGMFSDATFRSGLLMPNKLHSTDYGSYLMHLLNMQEKRKGFGIIGIETFH